MKARTDGVLPFSEGLAAAYNGNEWFHIKESGERAYPENYDLVSNFSEGLAWVKKGKNFCSQIK
jgi:hypothetical protein